MCIKALLSAGPHLQARHPELHGAVPLPSGCHSCGLHSREMTELSPLGSSYHLENTFRDCSGCSVAGPWAAAFWDNIFRGISGVRFGSFQMQVSLSLDWVGSAIRRGRKRMRREAQLHIVKCAMGFFD